MTKLKKTATLLLLAFVVIDLFYSFLQFNQMPLDGDLAESLVPADFVHKLYSDPFGIKMLFNGESYPNPNRVFSHLSLDVFMSKMPLWLQAFTNPINSVYASAALARVCIQAFIILLIAAAINQRKSWFNLLLSAAVITPLFQAKGYNRYMGVIDQSITYTFFYALPISLLILFYLPFYLSKISGFSRSKEWAIMISSIILIIILPFSGPLVPGVVLIIAVLCVANEVMHWNEVRINNMMKWKYWMIGLISIISLYSIYLGTFNSSNLLVEVPISERYGKMIQGVLFLITGKPGWVFLFAGIIVNIVLIKSQMSSHESLKLFSFLKWTAAFILIYILLLPLGGYREYRSHIVRYDTFLPVTIACIICYGASAMLLINNLPKRIKYAYLFFVAILSFVFTNADKYNRNENLCERNALKEIAASNDTIVKLKSDCNVLSWKIIEDYHLSSDNSLLMQSWKITTKRTLYFQE